MVDAACHCFGRGFRGRATGGVMIWESVYFCRACTANRRGQRRHALSRRAADVLGAQAWRVAGSSQTLLYKAGGHCRDTLVAQAQRDHGVVVYWPTLIKAQSSRLRRGIGLEIDGDQGSPAVSNKGRGSPSCRVSHIMLISTHCTHCQSQWPIARQIN